MCKKKLPPLQDVRRLYFDECLSMGEIADRYGASVTAVSAYLKRGGFVARKITVTGRRFDYEINHEVFSSCSSPESAYWIGFIMADGNVATGLASVLSVTLHRKDIGQLEELRSFLGSTRPIHIRREKYASLVVNSARLISDLSKYGIVPRKTGKEQVRNIPPEYLRDFIRGYFDGDGCISKSAGQLVFNMACASRSFLGDVQATLKKECDLGDVKIANHNRGCFRFNYKGNRQARRIRDYLYLGASVFMPRKRAVFETLIGEAA